MRLGEVRSWLCGTLNQRPPNQTPPKSNVYCHTLVHYCSKAIHMLYFKLWTKYKVKKKVKNSRKGERVCVCTYIFADTVDCGFVWMKGNTFMVFEEWGPTPATLGSCYPLLCLCSWGNFNEYSCSSRLLAPVRLSTGLPPPSSLTAPSCTAKQVFPQQEGRLGRRQQGG